MGWVGSAQNEQPGGHSPQNSTGAQGPPQRPTHSWVKHIWTTQGAWDLVPWLLWLPNLPWLHLDLGSPARRAAAVGVTLRNPGVSCDLILAPNKGNFALFQSGVSSGWAFLSWEQGPAGSVPRGGDLEFNPPKPTPAPHFSASVISQLVVASLVPPKQVSHPHCCVP